MPYTSFSNTIFLRSDANIACNKIIEALQVRFGINETNAAFALSGCAAANFQGNVILDNRVSLATFITSSPAMYAYLSSDIGNIINIFGSIAYQDRIQTTSAALGIEIWFSPTQLVTTNYQGVILQSFHTIPALLKQTCIYNIGAPVQRLALTVFPTFTPGSNILYKRDWFFGLLNITASYIAGETLPATVAMPLTIKNFFNYPEYGFRFSDYRLTIFSDRGAGNGLLADFYKAEVNGSTTHNLLDGAQVILDVSFLNLDLIDAGVYRSNIRFEASGVNNATSQREILETRTLPISLTVTAAEAQFANPDTLSFTHTIGQFRPPPKDIFINITGEFTVTYPRFFTILSPQPRFIENNPIFNVLRFNGRATLNVFLNSTVDALGVGFHTQVITVRSATQTILILVNLSLASSNTIRVIPNSLAFEAIIGTTEPEAQPLRIVSGLPYTTVKPDWLTIFGPDPVADTFNAFVVPINSENLTPGVYQEDIVLTSDIGEVRVPVTLTVKANAYTELLPFKVNFTKDQLYINLSTKNIGVYLKVFYKITVFDDGTTAIIEYPLDVPIFNGKAKFHPGETVEVLFPKIKTLDTYIPNNLAAATYQVFTYYRPIEIDITMEERAFNTDEIVKSHELNDILFVRGKKPLDYTQQNAIFYAQHPVRVTKNSFAMFNFLKRSGLHTINISLNGVSNRNITHDTRLDSLFGMVLDFKDFKEGDLIDVKLDGLLTKRFYVFPENKESYHIAWISEHEQIEMLEFTGSFSVDSDYESIENRVFDNLVDKIEKLSTLKSQAVSANTGWLLKNNHLIIDSLIRSRKAWLFLPGTDYKIEMVPQTKNLANFDSDRELYAYNVEFIINPEHDSEVYPR